MGNIINDSNANETSEQLKNELRKYNFTNSFQHNIDILKNQLLDDDTIIYRNFTNKKNNINFCAIFVDGMIDNEIINKNIISMIIHYKEYIPKGNELLDFLSDNVISVGEISSTCNVGEALEGILYGDTVVLVEGAEKAVVLNTKGWKTRSIEEPQAETVLRGPREGFTESLIMNISMIRRRINNSDLKFKFKKIGARTNTKIAIGYVDGIVNKKILKEIEDRVDRIDVDGILSVEKIREIIEDSRLSIFRTSGVTERPDVAAGKLLTGRIILMCDGSPVVLTLPFIFVEFFQLNEDYYESFWWSSLNRIIRTLSFIISISTPGVYVAVTCFHSEFIPPKLSLGINLAREGVPLPTAMECFIMLIAFEILREAGQRLPKHIGSAMSIVGALVLGDAAVKARLVSAPMVIVIAITVMAGFTINELASTLIPLRFIFLAFSSLLGLYGYIFVAMGVVIHLMSLRSIGVPYMLTSVEIDVQCLKDTAIRAPMWTLKDRTRFISRDKKRIKNNKRKR